jgi:hypothetical protein
LSVVRTRENGMNYWEGEFAFGDIFAETFIICVLSILKVLVIVANLKEDSNQVDQRNVITNVSILVSQGVYIALELHACMSLTARRRSPPVLLFTISIYSSSVGQVKLSRQKRSIP